MIDFQAYIKLVSIYYRKDDRKVYVHFGWYDKNGKFTGESATGLFTEEELYYLIKDKLKKEKQYATQKTKVYRRVNR